MAQSSPAQEVAQASPDQPRKRSSVWVECDKCKQWRRLPKELHDDIKGDNIWTCDQNPDADFNNCSIPQEISDAAIDLEIAQEAEEEEEQNARLHRQQKPAVWQCITRSIYTYRRRKKKTQDTTPICCCRPPADGSPGCGEGCLNRMLGNECNPETCPCGEQCGNSMFARRQYAKITQKRAGAKGFGLFTLEDLKEGQFIIEYIGEVLADEEYARRKEFYLESGQRHYYFMTIGNGETIDACRKGNLGRFINHSCSPNCKTEKWTVADDELAIGLFAIKDIPAGTELTFNYNFERYGDKPVKCLCGSANCSGYMGGKQSDKQDNDPNKDIIHEAEAREAEVADMMTDPVFEEPEPIMVYEEEEDENLAAILDAEVGLRRRDSRRLAKLAGSKGIAKVWDSDSDESEDFAETGSKGSMNLARGDPPSSRGQSDAESMQSSQHRRRLHKAADADLSSGLKRIGNGASLSRQQEKLDKLQQVRSNLTKMQTPSRKRPRPTSARDSSPSTSSAHMSREKRLNRTLSHDMGTTSGQNRLHRRPMYDTSRPNCKRSEVSRRLDSLVHPGTYMLRKADRDNIVKVLRLFNLCDLGFNSADKGKAEEGSPKRNIRARVVHNATDHSQDMNVDLPTSNNPQAGSSSGNLKPPTVATASGGHSQAGSGKADVSGGAHMDIDKGEAASREAVVALPNGNGLTVKVKADDKVDGVGIFPAVERLKSREVKGSPRSHRRRGRSRSRSRERGRRRDSSSPYSRGTDTESGEVKEPDSPATAIPLYLSARQQARLTDTSLLLEVILKTNYARAAQQFVECGVLRQLHTLLSRCLTAYTVKYDAVIGKLLRVVKELPFSSDDVWHTRNAQGTFADALRHLAEVRLRVRQAGDKHSPGVSTTALELLKKYPSTACIKPVEQPFKLDRLPYSPRPSPHFSSPLSDRGRHKFKGTAPSRQPSGRLAEWKPLEKEKAEKSSWSSGRIVDWTPPGDKAVEQTSRPRTSHEKPSVAGETAKASRETSQGRSTTVMRATYMHSSSKPSQDRPLVNGVHPVAAPQPLVPGTTRPQSLPGPPAFSTPLGRAPSFSGGQLEVQHGTPNSARPPHRLHMARGPSSPPGALPPHQAPPLNDRHYPSMHMPSPHHPSVHPSSILPQPSQHSFLPPPPALPPSLQLPHIPGPAPPKGPSPPKGPAPPYAQPTMPSTTAAVHTAGVSSHAAQAHQPNAAHAAAALHLGNAASDSSNVDGAQPPLPTDPPDMDLKLDRAQIASPVSSFSSLNPPPLPFSPPPLSPALTPQLANGVLPPPDSPPLPLPSDDSKSGQITLQRAGKRRNRWELTPEVEDGIQTSGLAAEQLPNRTTGLMGSAGQQSIDVTALPGPPDPLQHRTPATGGITSQHRQQEGTHGQTSSGTSPMGQQLMSSRQASPFRDQDSQQRSRTEEDFPFAWTTLDASFDKYLEFAITKSLAKFPKQIRREAGGDQKIIRRCKSKVFDVESKNLQHAQAHDRGATLQKAKIKASVGLLVKGYCSPSPDGSHPRC